MRNQPQEIAYGDRPARNGKETQKIASRRSHGLETGWIVSPIHGPIAQKQLPFPGQYGPRGLVSIYSILLDGFS